jgi:hypothetical protein
MEIRRIFSIGNRNTNNKPTVTIQQSEEKDVSPPQQNANGDSSEPVAIPENRYNPGLKRSLEFQKESGQKDLTELGKVEGTETAIRESVRLGQQQRERLDNLVNNAQRTLLKVSTVFPFALFPDDVIIDPVKITIMAREFIASAQTRIIMIKDVKNVLIETSPFFSTLKIIHGLDDAVTKIQPLWRKDAVKSGSILQGLMAANEQNIDITMIPVEESVAKIETLGRMRLAI